MQTTRLAIFAALASLAFLGCERKPEPSAPPSPAAAKKPAAEKPAEPKKPQGEKRAKKGELPDSAVVIKVGDIKTTKADYHAYLRMVEALYRNRHPSYSKEKIKAAVARQKMTAVSEILSRSLMMTAFGGRKCKIRADVRDDMRRSYVKTFCHKGQDFAELRSAMFDADSGTLFDKCFEQDLQIRCAMQEAYSNELTVTEADLRAAKERVASYNRRAAATNELIRARMEAALRKVKAGADFAALAREYSMAKEDGDGGDMGECVLSDFDGESDDYKIAVAQLKEGETTGVLESSVGHDILKAVKFIPKESSSTGLPTWHLARIHFSKPFFFEEVPDDELVEDLKKEKRDALLEDLMPKLRDLAKIEFPHGREMFAVNAGAKKPQTRPPSPLPAKPAAKAVKPAAKPANPKGAK